MRENFEAAVNFTLRYEGGLSHDSADPGGWTNLGVTHETLSRYLRRPASADDVKRLTVATAKDIYLRSFWQPTGCDALPAGLDAMAFDISVNNGPGRALQFLSRSTNTANVTERIESLHRQRMSFWQHLAIWSRFGKGWTAREVACRALALQLAGAAHA